MLQNSDELSFGGKFLSFLRDSAVYKPTIYSAVSSDVEKNIKSDYFLANYLGVDSKFVSSKLPIESEDNDSVLVDDSDFYLINWSGKPVHFDSGGKKSIFFDICDLGELYYLFPFNESINKVSNIDGLYDDYYQIYDEKTKRLIWNRR